MERHWTYKQFKTESERLPVEEWLVGLETIEQAKLDAKMENIALFPNLQYCVTRLVGHDRIYEIIVHGKREIRLLFCKGPRDKELCLLVGATKTSRKKKVIWNPRNAVEIAEEWCELILHDWRYAVEYNRA